MQHPQHWAMYLGSNAPNRKAQKVRNGEPARRRLCPFKIPQAATVCWETHHSSLEGKVTTQDTGLGIHVADLPTESLAVGSIVSFPSHWHGDTPTEGTAREEVFSVSVSER